MIPHYLLFDSIFIILFIFASQCSSLFEYNDSKLFVICSPELPERYAPNRPKIVNPVSYLAEILN
jgi:hypothetical protein